MKPLTDLEREELIHQYDPAKAHEYYLRTRQLKGRKPAVLEAVPTPKHKQAKATVNHRAHQRKALSALINTLQVKLQKLDALIKQREQEEASTNRKHKARKERAAKEHLKPKTAAEKAKIKRDNKQYRDKHKQALKTKARQNHTKSGKSASGSASGSASAATHKHSLSELKNLAIRVRGQIQVAKQKLAAL
jgi:hypothetical protein